MCLNHRGLREHRGKPLSGFYGKGQNLIQPCVREARQIKGQEPLTGFGSDVLTSIPRHLDTNYLPHARSFQSFKPAKVAKKSLHPSPGCLRSLQTGIKVNFYPAPQGSEPGFVKTPFPPGKGPVMEIKFN